MRAPEHYGVAVGESRELIADGDAARLSAVLQCDDIAQERLAAANRETYRCILEVVEAKLKPVRGLRRSADLAMGERICTIGALSGLELTMARASSLVSVRTKTGTWSRQAPPSPAALRAVAGSTLTETLSGLRLSHCAKPNLNFAIAAENFTK